MHSTVSTMLAAALALGANAVSAQSGVLSGVTMRVVEDLSSVDAVVVELEPNRSESADGAAADEAADDGERTEGRLEDRDAERPAAPEPEA